MIEPPPTKPHEPIWRLAMRYPNQGHWTAGEYLRLDDVGRVEFVEGHLEFLQEPTVRHQLIQTFLLFLLRQALAGTIGRVMAAPVRVATTDDHYREPDVVVILDATRLDAASLYVPAPDLAIEIVSPNDRDRDYKTKRGEYAAAGVREYWIIDPERESITMLSLDRDAYREIGTFDGDSAATSRLIPEFSTTANDVFAAGNGK